MTSFNDIETAVKACSVCNSLRPHQQKEPLKLHTVPALVFCRLRHIQMGQQPLSCARGLILRLFWNRPAQQRNILERNQQAETPLLGTRLTADAVFRWWQPVLLLCCFMTLPDFGTLHMWWAVLSIHSPIVFCERAVRSAKKLLQPTKRDGTNLYLNLLHICNMPRDKILGSPAQRLFFRRTQTILPICQQLLTPAAKATTEVKAQLSRKREAQKRYYDRSSKPLAPVWPNQVVRLETQKEHNKREETVRRAIQAHTW